MEDTGGGRMEDTGPSPVALAVVPCSTPGHANKFHAGGIAHASMHAAVQSLVSIGKPTPPALGAERQQRHGMLSRADRGLHCTALLVQRLCKPRTVCCCCAWQECSKRQCMCVCVSWLQVGGAGGLRAGRGRLRPQERGEGGEHACTCTHMHAHMHACTCTHTCMRTWPPRMRLWRMGTACIYLHASAQAQGLRMRQCLHCCRILSATRAT